MKKKFLMKIISWIAAAVLVLSATPLCSHAADTSGKCGPTLYWKYTQSDKTLTISGSGPMYSYRNAKSGGFAPAWYGLAIYKVVVEDGATTIGDYAFSYMNSATEFVLPNTVETIGNYAFYFCGSVDKVIIPDSVTEIGSNAFCKCTSLVCLEIGDGLEKTSADMCYGLSELRSVKLGKNCKVIGTNSFYGCENLIDINFFYVEEIGIQSFYKCNSLTEVHLGPNLKKIGSSAFGYCSSLADVIFDKTPVNVSSSFDYGSLADKSRKAGFFTICNGEVLLLKNGWEISLTEYEVPDGTKVIGGNAFLKINGLKKITIPDSVEYISDYCFCYADSVTEISFPASIKEIGIKSLGYDMSSGAYTLLKKINIVCRGCSPALEEYLTSLGKSYTAEHRNEKITLSYDCELGYMTADKCTVCGHIDSKEIFPAKGHIAEQVESGGGCCDDLVITDKCTVCGKIFGEKTIKAAGHIPSEVINVIVEPTCACRGYIAKTCTVCGEVVEKTEIEKKDHDIAKDAVTVERASCTESGKAGFACKICGEIFNAYEILPTGHSFGDYVKITDADEIAGIPSFCIRTCLSCGISEGKWVDGEGLEVSQNVAFESGTAELARALIQGADACVLSLDYNSDGILSVADTITLKKVTKGERCGNE